MAPNFERYRQMELDATDKAILKLIQQNNQIPHDQIGEIVNKSASSVRRRIQAMTNSEIIIGNVAITDPAKLGLTFIVQIKIKQIQKETDNRFREQMNRDAAISQCFAVFGEYDYLLIVHACSTNSYDNWAEKTLLTNLEIERYSTTVVSRLTKFTTLIDPAF